MEDFNLDGITTDDLPEDIKLSLENVAEAAEEVMRRDFDPMQYGLSRFFRLTNYVDIRGIGYKLPIAEQERLLDPMRQEQAVLDSYHALLNPQSLPRFGIGNDASVTPIRQGKYSIINTTSVTHAIVYDPYVLGKIACCNLLGNLYATGVSECHNVLMTLGISAKLTEKERNIVIPLIMKGFKECAIEAGSSVSGGHTTYNEWITIGGTASSVCDVEGYVLPNRARIGDVLVLTKPLGTHIAINARTWLDNPDRWSVVSRVISETDVRKAYQRAVDSMSRLNYLAARVMRKYDIHAVTDVGGYGIVGHAKLMAENQKKDLCFVIHNLPTIAKMAGVAKACGNMFSFFDGYCPETSGGLLICLSRSEAASLIRDLEVEQGYPAWVVGIVESGQRTARTIKKPYVIDVPSIAY